MAQHYFDTSGNGKIIGRIRAAAPLRIAGITGTHNSGYTYSPLCQGYADYAAMQLNRAVAGKPFAAQPSNIQLQKGLTPDLAADALDLVVEELAVYATAHIVELMQAADAFGIADTVASDMREVIG